jgi:hypothetical protein
MYHIAKHTPPLFYNGSLYTNLICMEELRKKRMCTVESFPRLGIPYQFQKENSNLKVKSTYHGNYFFLSAFKLLCTHSISILNISYAYIVYLLCTHSISFLCVHITFIYLKRYNIQYFNTLLIF